MNCPAHISASVNRKKGKLIVIDVNNNHNHEQSKELFKLYPENRQMSDDEKQAATLLLQLNVEARRIVSVIKDFSGKELTNRDIFNLKARVKHDGKDEINALLDVMEQVSDAGGKVQFQIDDKNELRVLYFQTEEMLNNMSKFPEIIFLDGTYRCNDKTMALYSILVEDGNGAGRVVAYGLLADERKETIVQFLDLFVKCNQSALNTEVVMIDKDFSELAAIRELLPQASVFLCHFHVMKALRTKISTLPISEEKKTPIREELQSMANSNTVDEYERHYDELKRVCDDSFIDYFNNNWHSIKEMWVLYYRNQKYTLKNNTNNRIESHHHRVKQALNSHKKSLAECVSELLDLERTRQRSRIYKDALDTVCVRYRHNDSTVETAQMFSIATAYASDLMIKQMEIAKKVEYTIADCNEENKYTVTFKGAVYATTQEDHKIHCTCAFYTTLALPCRHIFAVSLRNAQVLFAESWVPQRWRKEFQRSQPRTVKQVIGNQIVIQNIQPSDRLLTRSEKFKQMQVILNGIADLCSELGHEEFQSRFEQITQLYDVWKDNKQCVIAPIIHVDEVDSVIDPNSSDDADNAVPQAEYKEDQKPLYSRDEVLLTNHTGMHGKSSDTTTPSKDEVHHKKTPNENMQSDEASPSNDETTPHMPRKLSDLNTKPCYNPTANMTTPSKPLRPDTTTLQKLSESTTTPHCKPDTVIPCNSQKSNKCTPITAHSKDSDSTTAIPNITKFFKLKLPKSSLPKGRPKGAETNCIGLPTKRKRAEKRKKLSTKTKKSKTSIIDDYWENEVTSEVPKQFCEYIEKQISSGCVNIVAKHVQQCRFQRAKNIGTFMTERSNPAMSLCIEITALWEDFTTSAGLILLKTKSLLPLSASCSFDMVSYIELLSIVFVGAYQLKCDPVHFCQTLQEKPNHLMPTELVKRQTTNLRIMERKRMKIGNCTFNKDDCASLEGNNWLTDQAIHTYLALLQRELNQDCGRQCLVLPCHLYDQWNKKAYNMWQFPKKRFLDYSTIFMPVNVGGHHWVLMIASPLDGTVGVFNSIPSSRVEQNILNHWRQYLFLRNQTTEEQLPQPNLKEYPTLGQSDGCSCGIFTLMCAEALLAGLSPCIMRQCHVEMYRDYVRCRILENCKPNDDSCCDWPVCMEPPAPRKQEDGEVWVECDSCGIWVHLCCVNLESAPLEHEDYTCPKCAHSEMKCNMNTDDTGDVSGYKVFDC